jgi:hypothetical protein
MNLWPVINHALLYGVILCAVLFPAILLIARFNPEIMLKDYPPDIQAKYGPMSERTKRQRLPIGLAFTAVLVGLVVLSFQRIHALADGDLSFLIAFVHLFVMFSIFNLLDWLILDWGIGVAICPRFIILPGTEGMAGYRDYAFHFRGFLIGCVITFFTSLIVAGIVAFLF